MSDSLLTLTLALGGGVGACARHAVGELIGAGSGQARATLLVNLLGSALLGVVSAVLNTAPDAVSGSLLIGFCGGFTTFSSFAWQTARHYRQHSAVTAVINVLLNLCGCVSAYTIGLQLGSIG